MTIKKLLLLGSLTLFALSARATIFTGPVADDAYVTFGGYDLAWASPCSDGILEPSCGAIDMSEQSAYGWQVIANVDGHDAVAIAAVLCLQFMDLPVLSCFRVWRSSAPLSCQPSGLLSC